MGKRQRGRVAVVTGAANGIGQAFAERLAHDGAKIVIGDIAPADETIGLVEAAGSEALAVECDVSDAESVSRLANAAVDRFGQVDILVHNAGIYPITMFSEMTFEQWRKVMSVNLDSMFHTCHEFLPGMRERRWGRVLCMASTTFHAGTPGMSHYVASKGALIGLLRSVAAEIGEDGVTINALAPSLVRSKGTLEGPHQEMGLFSMLEQAQAIKRTQTPADLVGTLSFLASDDAAFITGQTLVVDGGWMRA